MYKQEQVNVRLDLSRHEDLYCYYDGFSEPVVIDDFEDELYFGGATSPFSQKEAESLRFDHEAYAHHDDPDYNEAIFEEHGILRNPTLADLQYINIRNFGIDKNAFLDSWGGYDLDDEISDELAMRLEEDWYN